MTKYDSTDDRFQLVKEKRLLVSPANGGDILLFDLGAVAFVLAAVGIYGMVSFVVARRLREYGLRAALGATPGAVGRRVLGLGMKPAVAGLVCGLLLSLAVSGVTDSLLFGVTAYDLPTYAMAVGLVLVVAATASFLPARRAARVDPVRVLTSE